MSYPAHMIPLIQKASNVCAHCRVRKQKCDRMLPKCERCAVKNQECDYTSPIQAGALPLEPLVYRKQCGHADLTQYGATELVNTVKACIEAPHQHVPATELLELVTNILGSVGFGLADALKAFGPCIQQWCPVLVEDHLLSNCDYKVTGPVDPRDGPQDPVLWMSLWLVLRKPCSPEENMGASELYAALKQVHALSQSAPKLELAVLQTGIILAVYEMGHGLRQQSFQTLASCTATLTFLELEAGRKQETISLDILGWIKASVAMLDRQLPLSMISERLPLTIPPNHPISVALTKTLGPVLPPVSSRQSATSQRKVFIRTGAAIAAGHAIEYIYSRQQGSDPEKPYDQADAIVNRCISMLVVKPDSLQMFHCDAVPMTFCSHILLQLTQIQYLRSTFSNANLPVESTPEYQKAILALRFSRSMSWEMVRMSTQLVKSEDSVSWMTLAGLCSMLRAGLAVLETNRYIDDDVIREGEVQAYLKILRWFAARWTIGNEYLERTRQVLGNV